MCKIVLLNFVHHLNYKIIRRKINRSWILLPSSGKKGEEDRKPICWASLGLVSDLEVNDSSP
jgi:hypothetical protein